MKIQVGVLSIIGSFAEHEESLKKAFAAGRLEGKWKEDDLEVIRLISENQVKESYFSAESLNLFDFHILLFKR